MEKYLKKNFSLISFIFVPLVYLWDPNWLGFLGIQPYWPLFWLLPWSIMHGSFNGFIAGLFLGLTLDSISPDSSFTQIPGLAFCGIWFGKLSTCSNVFVCHFRYGLICSISSLLCSTLYFSQILIKNFSDKSIFLYSPSIKNIFAQLFITGLLAPLFCSWLLRLFKRSKARKTIINFNK